MKIKEYFNFCLSTYLFSDGIVVKSTDGGFNEEGGSSVFSFRDSFSCVIFAFFKFRMPNNKICNKLQITVYDFTTSTVSAYEESFEEIVDGEK